MSSVTQFELAYQSDQAEDPERSLADRLLNIQFDIWNLEFEQARLRTLLRIRRAVRQQLARHARIGASNRRTPEPTRSNPVRQKEF